MEDTDFMEHHGVSTPLKPDKIGNNYDMTYKLLCFVLCKFVVGTIYFPTENTNFGENITTCRPLSIHVSYMYAFARAHLTYCPRNSNIVM